MHGISELHDAVNYRYLKSNSPRTVFIAIEMRSLKPPEDSVRISELSLVIDCSSSMQGEKLKQAKKSALQLFKLLGDDDYYYYISVISFDKSARVALSSTEKSGSKAAEQDVIRNLKLGRGTNIYEGLELAFKELSDGPGVYDSSSNVVRPRRIVLLTDGHASVGKIKEADIKDLSKRIRQKDITVSTIGIGDKYDQELLQAIAESGGGLPYHVKEINDLQNISVNKQMS